jgi:uncharacterized protein (TIGR02271 family)
MASMGSGRAVPMGQAAGFRLGDGRPDVRGWPVVSSDGKQLGTVADLLVDAAAGQIRYLEVDLDDTLLVDNPERHVLVPVGCAHVEAASHVVVDALAARDLPMLPPYEPGGLDEVMETSVRAAFTHMRGGKPRITSAGVGAYDDCFDEDRFFDPRASTPPAETAASTPPTLAGAIASTPAGTADGEQGRLRLAHEELHVGKRQVDAGAINVRKVVETEHVERMVPTEHEEVTIERRPVPEGSMPIARTEGDETFIPLYEEVLVIEKRLVAREELVIRKHRVVVDRKIEADLRRERAEVVAEGKVEVDGGAASDSGDGAREI